jgi:hypothetical protein
MEHHGAAEGENFLMATCKQLIPTNEVCHHRGMSDSSTCQFVDALILGGMH